MEIATKFWRKPLDLERWKIPSGEVKILKDRCKGCNFCIKLCPAEVLKESEDFNELGYHYPIVEKPDKCINCSYCQAICPELAIWSIAKET
ncbi:MAG: 4Fe-4S binding protein [Candidatus Thermoplasmatota archaeon]|nr:4Fe-4S binding protein [Candidatus Thermoplasmatota archaeon]MDI6856085.1 4Fe-4S binding protein [Candidatus Thermoplasmatota archaeon]MDI6887306.1 4Fe-4S binding protein [Candidatus Thermoplasmatota archaeon]